MLAQRVCASTDASRGVGAQREAQQLVVADLRAQARGVVAELTDLGRGLVDEREMTVGRAHRAGGEQRIGGCARRRAARSVGIVEVETVPGHEHVQTGRVAAAHLEPVDRRQRDLRSSGTRRARPGPTARRRARSSTARARSDAVLADRPERVLARDRAPRSAPRCRRRRARSRRAAASISTSSAAAPVAAVLERRPGRSGSTTSAPTPSPSRSARSTSRASRAADVERGDGRAPIGRRPSRASCASTSASASTQRGQIGATAIAAACEPRATMPHIAGILGAAPPLPNCRGSTDAPRSRSAAASATACDVGLDHDPHERLGARTPAPAPGPSSPSSASTARTASPSTRRRAEVDPLRDPDVHEHLRVRGSSARRAPTAGGPIARTRSATQQPGEQPVAGRRVLARTRCAPTARRRARDRAPASRRRRAGRRPASRRRRCPASRSARRSPRFDITVTDDRVVAQLAARVQVERGHRHDLVAVDELAALVDREHAVAVAVEREPERGAVLDDRAAAATPDASNRTRR